MDSKNLVSHLVRFLLIDKKEIRLIILYGILSNILYLFMPLGAQYIFANVRFGTLFQPVLIISFLVMVMLGASTVLQTVQVYLVEIIQRRIFARVSIGITNHITKVKYTAFDNINGAELMNRFFEVLNIKKIQALILMDGLSIFLQTIIGLILLAFYNPYLLAYDLFLIALLYIVIFKFSSGGIQTSLKESKEKYKVAEWLEQVALNPQTFNSSQCGDYASEMTDKKVGGYLKARQSHFKILFKQYMGTFGTFAIANVLLLMLGGWLVINGELSPGQLVAAELVVSGIVSGFNKLGKYIESGYDLVASFDKLSQIFSLPQYEEQVSKLNNEEQVETFEFLNAQNQNSSFSLKQGDNLCLLGTSGSGKTKLSEFLAGYRDIPEYKVNLNGINQDYLSQEYLRKHIFLISHPGLFSGSVLDNLLMGLDAQEHKKYAIELLKRFQALEYFESLPDGLETNISTDFQIPEHIQSLISISRVLLQNPSVVILDGLLDTFDLESKNRIINLMKNELKERIMIVFTSDHHFSESFESKIKI